MATKPVKYFSSSHTGAPQLSGQAGKMVDILNACLVNGFNPKTLTALSITSGVLTGSCTAHGYVTDQTLLVSGANESELNGEWTVSSYTADTFTAAATGVSNVTGTGTIACKVAPLGWNSYAGTQKAAFSSSDPLSNKLWYRIDDTGTTSSRIVGYETMWGVDSGVNAFPTEAQRPGGLYLVKSQSADATVRTWAIVGDSRTFYVQRSNVYAYCEVFGEFPSTYDNDAYNTVITGHTTATPTNTAHILVSSAETNVVSVGYIARGYNQLGSSSIMQWFYQVPYGGRSGATSGLAVPMPGTNTIIIASPMVQETAGIQPRGYSTPGLYGTPQNNTLTHTAVYTPASNLPGRRFVCLDVSMANNGGKIFIDITGPWW